MRTNKEIVFYIVLALFVIVGAAMLFLLPPETLETIVSSVIALGIAVVIFLVFCFILLFVNGFIKYTTVPGGRTFMRDRYRRF